MTSLSLRASALAIVFGSSVLLTQAQAAGKVVFQLDGIPYSENQLPEKIQQQLFEARMEAFRTEESILAGAVMQMELDRLAKESGKSKDQIANELFKVDEPDDAAVVKFYEANKARIPYALDKVKPQVKQLLVQQSIGEKQTEWLEDVKKDRLFEMGRPLPLAPLVEIDTKGFPSKGPSDAKFHIVEFADYQCPHCKKAAEALQAVFANHKDVVRITFMDLPVNRSGISRSVAEGAYCADQQGQFWPFHDEAFKHQAKLSKGAAAEIAEHLKLDMVTFKKCLVSDAPAQQIARSEAEAIRLHVSSTPTIYLNGRLQNLHDIEAELSAKIASAK